MSADKLSIEDVKLFIGECRKKKENWLRIAERSWKEAKKRNDRDKLYGGTNLDVARRWAKFPLWWSAWKIRQPITLARLPVPVLKDTQSDDDPIGRTACVIGERLIKAILKTFDAFPEFSAGNDDFLITNLGWGRVFYCVEECEEPEKLRLQTVDAPMPEPVQGQPPPQPQQPIVVGPDGQPVDQYLTDEFGPYLLTGKKITVEDEQVYFENGLYSNLYVDPYAIKWNKVEQLAFEYSYSYRQFKEKFGEAALATLTSSDLEEHRTGKKPIIVFEYHDKALREVRWFAENSADFFQPSQISSLTEMADVGVNDLEEVTEQAPRDNSDLYGLSNFFPCSAPLIINQSTDEFWPTPEFFQVNDILEDVHSIVARMILLTKAIRVRFLFDKAVPEMKTLIQETGEAGGLGVTNLAQALMAGKGTLNQLVAYFPVAEMIEGLNNMYQAFNQRLDMFYQVTGLNDILRGQANPDSDKTYGERQMEGKFALNRVEPLQRKIQEWVKDNYQLLMELALKMFEDKTLDQYITPQTLDQEDKQRYVASLELLRANKRARFRVDFETDSTIAVNEQWRRAQAIEAANVITKMQESIANTAKEYPELVESQVKLMGHVIGELTDGKLFFDEIQESIQQLLEKAQQPKPQDFNPDQAAAELAGKQFIFDQQSKAQDDKMEMMKLQATQQIEMAKLQQQMRIKGIEAQLMQIKMGIDQGASQAELQNAVVKLQADIAQGWEDLNLKKEALLLAAQQAGGKQNLEAFKAQIDARVRDQEITLEQADLELRAHEASIAAHDYHTSLEERIATEQRLQAEHAANVTATHVDSATKLIDAMTPEPQKGAPVSVDLSKTLQIKMPTPATAGKKGKGKDGAKN